MVFAISLIVISSYIIDLLSKEYNEDKKKMEDLYFFLIIGGFVGGRLVYGLMNFHLFKDNILSIFKLSHYNISLFGGIIWALIILMIASRKLRISFDKLLKIFVIPFYFSMAIGIWVLIFDRLLPASKLLRNNPTSILITSFMFLAAMILELTISKKSKNKHITKIIFGIVIIIFSFI